MKDVFSKAFGNEHGKIGWVETSRHGPKEFFGKKPDEELNSEYFSGRIPPGIGESFNYKLKACGIEAYFGQTYYNCMPLATQQHLLFQFGKKRNPHGEYDSPFAGEPGFESLTQAKMAFYRGRFGIPKTEINMESQNLGIRLHGGWSERNSFTENGNEMMVDLISQKRNILKIAGIRDDEHGELETFLDLIGKMYKEGSLEPR
jgi:hypothetical protein